MLCEDIINIILCYNCYCDVCKSVIIVNMKNFHGITLCKCCNTFSYVILFQNKSQF